MGQAGKRLIAFLIAVSLCGTASLATSFDPHSIPTQLNPTVPLWLDQSTSADFFQELPMYKDKPLIAHMLELLTTNTEAMKAHAIPHASCAVVGTSQNLLGKNYGPLIDKHDYVFRMNSAPIASYEKDVGTKTTHHLFVYFHGHYARGEGGVDVPFYGPDTVNIMLPVSHLRIRRPHETANTPALRWRHRNLKTFYMDLAKALDDSAKGPRHHATPDMARMKKVPNLVMLTPDFMRYVDSHWFKPEAKGDKEYASTGFLATILAQYMCGPIDLFGFGADKDGKWGHYFSPALSDSEHRPDYQELFLNYLESTGRIKQYH